MHYATDSLADSEDQNLKNILSKWGRNSTHRLALFENKNIGGLSLLLLKSNSMVEPHSYLLNLSLEIDNKCSFTHCHSDKGLARSCRKG
jgi:hypothetical protein